MDSFSLTTAKFVRRVSRGDTPFTYGIGAIASVIAAAATFLTMKQYPKLADLAGVVSIVLPVAISFILFQVLLRFSRIILAKQPAEVMVSIGRPGNVFAKVPVRKNAFRAPDEMKLAKVTAQNLAIFSQLNFELFGKTRYAYAADRIRERNKSIFDKDPLSSCIVSIDLPFGKHKAVGISHVLALSPAGEAAYLVDNGLSDESLSGVHIASSDEASKDFLLFSLGVERKLLHSFAAHPAVIGGLFVDHLRIILLKRMEQGVLPPSINIWAQITKPSSSLGAALSQAGMKPTTMKSGDGSTFYKLELTGVTDQQTILAAAKAIHTALSNSSAAPA